MNDIPITTPVAARLSTPRRIAIYTVGFGLWASGGLWLLFHFFVAPHFGAMHPLEPWWLKLHGAFGFAALWIFGLLWGVHVTKGWTAGRARWSGGAMVAVLICLTITGYLLYYSGDEDFRAAVSLIHWVIGLAAPAAFFLHYPWSRRNGDSEANSAPQDRASVIELKRRRLRW
jgi:hypothetical protein